MTVNGWQLSFTSALVRLFLFQNWYFLDRKSFNHIHNSISNLKYFFSTKTGCTLNSKEKIFLWLSHFLIKNAIMDIFFMGILISSNVLFHSCLFFGKLCWMYFYLFDLGLLWTARSVLPSAWPDRFPIERLRLHKINFPQWNSPSDWTPFRWPGSHSGIFFYYICMENMKHRLCSKARTY